MNRKPILSVLSPTYNCSDYITRSYDCLSNQLFTDWEWIVVDDGSSDNSLEILNAIDDPRIKIISYEINMGRGYARNLGLKNCNTDIVVIWDIDDLYLPERLYLIYNSLVVENYDFFASCALVVRNNFEIKGVRSFYKNKLYKSFVHPTLAFKKSTNVGYDETMRAGEDLLPMVTLSNNFKGFYSDKILMLYFEDREINLRKSIFMHDSHMISIKRIFKQKIINLSLKEKFIINIGLILKKIALRILLIFPSIYLKSVAYRDINNTVKISESDLKFLENYKNKYNLY
ncbi:glycosyltransferase family 2 protein [Flavobacterium sp. NRK1]|uniref:glycosyltransferase family 2 protein n=1 Tax=Flavobacterium sp. NRK1 TaxID=2954929 RepID=UPI002092149D|nr:glycosyltransferase family 2 protein [Flavobacterium sp. NRK1]MCO6146888.1 glycosyltransferase [Flavobacterium sp. NRK1]